MEFLSCPLFSQQNWYISFTFSFGINSGLQVKREGNCKEGTFIDGGFHRNASLIVIEVF